MNKNPSPAQIVAWRGLLTVQARIVTKIERGLVAANLPPLTWYDVLFALHEQPGKQLRMSELADQVLLSRSGLTRLVDRLEKAGYVQRAECADDKRGLLVCLTVEGTQAMRTIWPVYRKGIAEWFAQHLTEPEVEMLTSVFRKINNQ